MLIVASYWVTASHAFAEPKVPVTGHASFTEQFEYWGGMAPNYEKLRGLADRNRQGAIPKPLGGQRLIVRKGKVNSISPSVEVVSGADGVFSLSLEPGTYCVVEESKRDIDAKGGAYVDRFCMQGILRQCDAVWNVTPAALQQFSVVIAKNHPPPCYNGPRPPSRPVGR